MTRVIFIGTVLTAALWGGEAGAAVRADGTWIRTWWGDAGLWNDPAEQRGLQVLDAAGAWREVTWPGGDGVGISASWRVGSGTAVWGVDAGGASTVSLLTTVSSNLILTPAGQRMHTRWEAGVPAVLGIDKWEIWDDTDHEMVVHFVVTNLSSAVLDDVQAAFGFDVDADRVDLDGDGVADGSSGLALTDVSDSDGDGLKDWMWSAAPLSGLTVGMGACVPAAQTLGFAVTAPSAGPPTMSDPDGDAVQGWATWRADIGTLQPGGAWNGSMVLLTGSTLADAATRWPVWGPARCQVWDADGDLFRSPDLHGDDCDDRTATVHPGAPEVADDGIDQDCDGIDARPCYVDADHDGYGAGAVIAENSCAEAGLVPQAGDCDDTDSRASPAGVDLPGDGVDQDCDGSDSTSVLDSDGDGLLDVEEPGYGTDPDLADTDSDGLRDGLEVLVWFTSPLNPDSDFDGASDGEETGIGREWGTTDPLDPDTDDDGLLDGDEIHGLGPLLPWGGTDPTRSDSDLDGLSDLDEVMASGPLESYKPTDPVSADTDLDGLSDGQEVLEHGTDPNLRDTDADGLDDGNEVSITSDPLSPDTDADGLTDGEEGVGDLDGDGVPDLLDPLVLLWSGATWSGCQLSPTPRAGAWLALLMILARRRRCR